ncbi:NADH-quinone oxidoreductase subunit NuoH [Chloroflexota bacterium]
MLQALIGIVLAVAIAFVVIIILVWCERRGLGQFQLRAGPNRIGPFGLLQPFADAIKLLTKEDIVPAKGDRLIHWIAPVLVFVPTLMLFAVIPVDNGGAAFPSLIQKDGIYVDLNIGILYIIAISTLEVIAVIMAAWSSNNKYSLVAAMRTAAQMISYEIPMVLAIVGVLLAVGSMQMSVIVGEQRIPFILLQPLGFLIYFLGATAELNRSPMDMLEAESEIVAGYQTEYSGMKFAIFYLAEFGNTAAVAAITAVLFLGGWKQPFSQEWFLLPPWLWLGIKMLSVYFILLWMRATLPRIRVDQLMGFAWKFLLPLALINILVIAMEVHFLDSLEWWLVPVNFAIAASLILLWSKMFFQLGRGRIDVAEIRAWYS